MLANFENSHLNGLKINLKYQQLLAKRRRLAVAMLWYHRICSILIIPTIKYCYSITMLVVF